jgi:ATP diphosphatase
MVSSSPPPVDQSAAEAVERLAAVMQRLRSPDGCAWDREQTFATIAPYTLEEAYEVADAIERGNLDDLREELGDLLLQVVFHAQMAAEQGAFDLRDVAAGIADKMVRRHPHVFGDALAGADHRDAWEALKAAEKSRTGALDGVAHALPALLRAQKLQSRAARVGFDWPDVSGPRAKIDEELAEIEAAEPAQRAEEVGDLLFAVVNYARHLGIDAEEALRAANGKFERRFAAMELAAGPTFAALDLNAKEALWQSAKSDQA